MVLNLEPSLVWEIFTQISSVPRETEKEEKIGNWIINWCKEKNLNFNRDEIGNIIIWKNNKDLLQNLPLIGLQVHMDMVCVKEPTSLHDFNIDPLELIIEENTVKTKGTSLGADNGIGLSIAMALLLDQLLVRNPLEVIITIEEEKHCRGAQLISPDFFKSRTIINLDSTTFGEIIIGSVGLLGINIKIHPESHLKSDCCQCKIHLDGLKGGHSGLNVNSKYLNAIKVMNDFLIQISNQIDIQLVSFKGGDLFNNIPNSAEICFTFSTNQIELMHKEFGRWNQHLRTNSPYEPNLSISSIFENVRDISTISTQCTQKTIHLLQKIPNGIISFSSYLPYTVESSVQIGTIKADPESVTLSLVIRSLKNEYLESFHSEIQSICSSLNGTIEIFQNMPAWNGNYKSNLVKLMSEKYSLLFQHPPLVKAIHAGMEPSYFFNKSKDISIIALGANISNIHSTQESVDIDSVSSLYYLLREFLNDHKILKKL